MKNSYVKTYLKTVVLLKHMSCIYLAGAVMVMVDSYSHVRLGHVLVAFSLVVGLALLASGCDTCAYDECTKIDPDAVDTLPQMPMHAEWVQKAARGEKTKVVFLGTSLTDPATCAGAWCAEVVNKVILHATCNGADAHVISNNYGCSGKTSQYGVDIISRDAPDADAYFVEYAINDAYYPYDITPLDCYLLTRDIVTALLAINPKAYIYLLKMNPPTSAHAAMRPRWREYYAVYDTIASRWQAQAYHVHCIDICSAWQQLAIEHGTDSALWQALLPDGIHPSEVGATTVNARVICSYLNI